jgi:hypothetical protein
MNNTTIDPNEPIPYVIAEHEEIIIGTIALPCGLGDLNAITRIHERAAKKENRKCYLRQRGQFMEFFTLPAFIKPTKPTT